MGEVLGAHVGWLVGAPVGELLGDYIPIRKADKKQEGRGVSDGDKRPWETNSVHHP